MKLRVIVEETEGLKADWLAMVEIVKEKNSKIKRLETERTELELNATEARKSYEDLLDVQEATDGEIIITRLLR